MTKIKLYLGDKFSNSEKWRKQFKQKINSDNIEFISSDYVLKNQSDYIIYTFSPETKSMETIFNVVNDSNHFKKKIVFLVLNETNGFTTHQVKSLIATGKMVKLNGGEWFDNWNHLIEFLR